MKYILFEKGEGKTKNGGTGVAYESLGVRPMIRIRLTDEMIKDNNLTVGKNKNFSQMYVVLGSQDDKQGSNDLEWQILEYDEENNRAFLLSRYLVGEGSYKEFEVYSDKNVATWADSSIREWLNKDFYDSVFSKEEQSLIKQVEIENPDNPESKTIGGENTSDKIFLLSIPEVQKYFGEKKLKKDCASRICTFKNGTVSEWWLRSPGIGDAGKKTGSVSYVDEPGGVYGNYAAQNGAGIRPALWISLEN